MSALNGSADRPEWVPEGLALDKPNIARMYDYVLGGFHNFEVDRRAVEQLSQVFPEISLKAQSLRAFTRRFTLFLIERGIDQFLDIGSGIPTVGNVHQVAQGANPAARIVYVDIDPVAIAHSRAILKDNPNATAIQADLRQPRDILDHPETQRLLDFQKPLGLLLVAVIHFVIDDQEAYRAVRLLREALAPGSYLVIVHGTYDGAPTELVRQIERVGSSTPTSTKYRTVAQVEQFFADFALVDPGLVPVALWRPESPDDPYVDEPHRFLGVAGVGCKP